MTISLSNRAFLNLNRPLSSPGALTVISGKSAAPQEAPISKSDKFHSGVFRDPTRHTRIYPASGDNLYWFQSSSTEPNVRSSSFM
jgi:hypothetical protein